MILEDLGFKLVKYDEILCYRIYENEDHDHRINISYDGEVWHIYSVSTVSDKDWYGNPYYESMGMTLEETQACLNMIEDFKKSIEFAK